MVEDECYDKVTLYVPTGTKDAYGHHSYWGKFKTIKEFTPTGVRHIKEVVESDEGQIYGVDGAQRTTLSRGLNIMRSKEGMRKILCN